MKTEEATELGEQLAHNCYEWAVRYEFADGGREYHGYECGKCGGFIEAS